jgi:hypothetical protein
MQKVSISRILLLPESAIKLFYPYSVSLPKNTPQRTHQKKILDGVDEESYSDASFAGYSLAGLPNRDGNIFITDSGNNRIRNIDTFGIIIVLDFKFEFFIIIFSIFFFD